MYLLLHSATSKSFIDIYLKEVNIDGQQKSQTPKDLADLCLIRLTAGIKRFIGTTPILRFSLLKATPSSNCCLINLARLSVLAIIR